MLCLHFRRWCLATCCLICSACGPSESNIIAPILTCELRAPKALRPDPKTRIELVSHGGESGVFLWAFNQKEQKEEGEVLIFQPDEFVLHAERKEGRALVVEYPPGQAQVFQLPIPRTAKAADWSQWRRPDYIAKGNVGWAFMNNRKPNGVTTDIPPDCFEMRYKIEMKDLGPRWRPGMKRKGEISK